MNWTPSRKKIPRHHSKESCGVAEGLGPIRFCNGELGAERNDCRRIGSRNLGYPLLGVRPLVPHHVSGAFAVMGSPRIRSGQSGEGARKAPELNPFEVGPGNLGGPSLGDFPLLFSARKGLRRLLSDDDEIGLTRTTRRTDDDESVVDSRIRRGWRSIWTIPGMLIPTPS